jgi:hypothetical protein
MAAPIGRLCLLKLPKKGLGEEEKRRKGKRVHELQG